MPIISDIVEQKNNKSRLSIYVDNRFFCGMSKIVAYDNRLKVGLEVDTEKLVEIMFESEKMQATEKALGYITSGLKTKKQIRDYLKRKGYIDKVIEFAVDYLVELKYLDDLDYANMYIQDCKMKGKIAIKNDLYNKGVDSNIIDLALQEFSNEEEMEQCKNLCMKYLGNKKISDDYAFKQKVINYLRTKGFNFDTIKVAVEEALGENYE